eukprot:TRINITY_DN13482_c0_g1_i1.p1 TRINITY_DN13482_c0_g1~~TRINITY_DN13482_c0_g1_i1.p1  ORF type:complete len:363 (-),score=87.50 TRINITY_DN13482_c0_g1_i1:245-1333(-)
MTSEDKKDQVAGDFAAAGSSGPPVLTSGPLYRRGITVEEEEAEKLASLRKKILDFREKGERAEQRKQRLLDELAEKWQEQKEAKKKAEQARIQERLNKLKKGAGPSARQRLQSGGLVKEDPELRDLSDKYEGRLVPHVATGQHWPRHWTPDTVKMRQSERADRISTPKRPRVPFTSRGAAAAAAKAKAKAAKGALPPLGGNSGDAAGAASADNAHFPGPVRRASIEGLDIDAGIMLTRLSEGVPVVDTNAGFATGIANTVVTPRSGDQQGKQPTKFPEVASAEEGGEESTPFDSLMPRKDMLRRKQREIVQQFSATGRVVYYRKHMEDQFQKILESVETTFSRATKSRVALYPPRLAVESEL